MKKRRRKGEYNLDENIFGGGDEEERRKERKVCSMRDHSNNFKLAGTPAGQPAKISGFAKSFAFSDANMQTRFSDFLAGIIINDVWGVVRSEILTLSFGEIHRLS